MDGALQEDPALPPTILCVDDDRNFCRILSRAFQGEGYQVRTAHDGDSALELAAQEPPDLIALDLLLPRRDGFEVLEALREQEGGRRRTPVLLLSGCSATAAYRSRAAALGASALLTKPVPLDQLLSVAAKEIGGVSALAGRSRRSGAPSRRMPKLEGRLEETSFATLLHHLHGLRASGVLHLEHRKKKKKIQLREGHPVGIQSNLVDECLGNLLVASGKISWDTMHESVRRARSGEGLQGQILVAMHMLDEEDLARALRNQAEEKLFEIFAWSRGRFRFQRGVRLRRSNVLALQRSPANIIMEGARTRVPLRRIHDFFSAHGRRVLAPGESPFYRFQDIELDPVEEHLLGEVDGTRTLAQIVPGDERSKRTLYGWIVTGLVEMRDAPTPEAVPVARPSETRPDRRVDLREASVRAELAAMAEAFRGRDYFGVLGVPQRTNDEDVRNAYFGLAKDTHPDRFRGSGEAVKQLAEEVFGLISEAYEALCDGERRVEYLRSLRNRERDAADMEEGQRALRAELLFQQGERQLRQKDAVGAARSFQEAMRIYPEEGEYEAYFGWAWYLAEPSQGRLDEALEHAHAARKLAPERETIYLLLGRLYRAAHRHKAAERAFGKAVELNPDCVEAVRELRLIHMRRVKQSKGIVRRVLGR